MKRICSIILVTLALAVLSAATFSFSCSMRAYAEELSSFVVGINHSSGGTLQVIDADGNSSTINRGDTVTVQQGDNLVIRAIPDSCFGVTSIKINDEEVTPATTFTLNNISKDCSIYVEFRLTDIDKLMEYSSYFYLSEYNNMSSLAEDQILRAVCSYSDEDINGMVAREVFKKCFDIFWQDLIASFTDRPSYEEEQIDKLTDTFVENYYNELVKDDNFTQVVDLSAYTIPFEKTFKEIKSWSSISKDELIALRGEWLYQESQMFDYKPISFDTALLQSKKELGKVYEDWDKYLDFFDSAYSFQEFVLQMVMLRDIDRQIIEDLYNATDDSTVLHTGLKRRLDRIDSSDISLMVQYAIDKGLVSELGGLTKKLTFGILGSNGNAVGLVYAAISSGIKLYEKLYDVASVGDYVIACYACDAQSYFFQQIETFVTDKNTDTKKFELLIRAHSAAAKTAVSKGENAISKLYNGSLTDENKLKEKEEIEYKFALYKPWVNSSACSYTTFINQWINYAEARENGEPMGYNPPSVYTADISATGNVSFDSHSFTIEGDPNVKFYSNVRLNIELADDATLVVSDNYVADVSISKIILNNHTLDVTGSVSVGGMTLDAGTLSFNNEPLIQGQLNTGENTILTFKDGVTIKGGLNASKGTTTINGNVKHTGGVFSPNNIVINGNYYGYSEDELGNKLPGGYISMGSNSDYL
ncbi:MAG: hypothetical protein ACI4WS_08780, partial [Oscillospiraceae bacterium]